MARVQVAVGLSIAFAPLVLGVLADHAGVHSAFTLELGLLLGAIAVLTPLRVAGSHAAAAGVTSE
jgi:hypothetical protein